MNQNQYRELSWYTYDGSILVGRDTYITLFTIFKFPIYNKLAPIPQHKAYYYAHCFTPIMLLIIIYSIMHVSTHHYSLVPRYSHVSVQH